MKCKECDNESLPQGGLCLECREAIYIIRQGYSIAF